jgi:hypothetical protein
MQHSIVLIAFMSMLLPACKSASASAAEVGLVARAVVGNQDEGRVIEQGVVGILAWNGDAFLAGGEISGQAGLFLSDTGAFVFSPHQFEDGAVYVKVRSTGFEWKGRWGDPLPMEAMFAFRPGEAEEWGVTFSGSDK